MSENFFVNYKNNFAPNKLDVNAAYEFKTMWVVVRNGEVIDEKNDGIVNLASTSKPFTMDLLSRVLPNGKFIATKDLIKELIFRKQFDHLAENPAYTEALLWLRKNKISNFKSKLRAKLKGTDVGLYNWKAEDFPKIEIDFKELCFNALTLSSNSAIEIARNKLEEILGNSDKVQQKLDELKIAPTLQMHQGGFKLLSQSRANSGDLKEIVLAFDKLIKSADAEILFAMKNNKVFFDVGITPFVHRNDVYEKTGMAWPVNYGEEYAKLGYPPHMVMGTLFSIKENDTFTTFGIFKVIAIAVPRTLDSNGFPNIYEKNYTNYVNLVKYKFLNQYRKEMLDLVGKDSFAVFNKLTFDRSFSERFKRLILHLLMLF